MLKIKIKACSIENAWYKNAIGEDIDCILITDKGTAIIDANTVNEFSGSMYGVCGRVIAKDFKIVREDTEKCKRSRKVAYRRYYMNRLMKKEYEIEINAITRTIKLPYANFPEIPIGLRFYIGQCIQMQYNIQYELF